LSVSGPPVWSACLACISCVVLSSISNQKGLVVRMVSCSTKVKNVDVPPYVPEKHRLSTAIWSSIHCCGTSPSAPMAGRMTWNTTGMVTG
jgi:hypothetical protein